MSPPRVGAHRCLRGTDPADVKNSSETLRGNVVSRSFMVDGHRKIEQFEYRGLEEHDDSRDPARCGREHVERVSMIEAVGVLQIHSGSRLAVGRGGDHSEQAGPGENL